jgi:hypothetical protein
MKRMIVFILVAFVLLQVSAWAQGCAMCRRALEASPEGQAVAASFNDGILVLMGAPYIVAGGAAFAILRAYRKKKRETQD